MTETTDGLLSKLSLLEKELPKKKEAYAKAGKELHALQKEINQTNALIVKNTTGKNKSP